MQGSIRQEALISQPGIGVGHISLGVNVALPPSNLGPNTEGRGTSTQGEQGQVAGTTLGKGKHNTKIVPNR